MSVVDYAAVRHQGRGLAGGLMTDRSMDGKVCAITGPTSGIGRATALALGRKGAKLLLLCRSAEKGAALVADLKALGAEAEVIEANLASLSSVARAAERLSTRAPQLDVLINNAGLINARRRETADGSKRCSRSTIWRISC